MNGLNKEFNRPSRSKSQESFSSDSSPVKVPEPIADKIYNSFGKRNPLATILMCSRGPFLAEIFKALYELMDTYWISAYTFEVGNAAMTIVTVMELIIKAFSAFMGYAAAYKLALLRGEGKSDQCPQVFADLLRFAIILSVITPAILLPCVDPMLTFFGADGEIRKAGQDYLFPSIIGCGVSIINVFLCGCLQSEGKSLIAGIDQTIACTLNMAIFDPIFIGVCRFGLKGAAYAKILSDFIALVVFGTLFALKQFESQCALKNIFFCGISAYTFAAIKIGFANFISQFCFTIPSFVSRKYIEMGSKLNGTYKEMFAAFNPVSKFWSLPGSYAMALSICTFPACSYAIGRRDGTRVKKLLITGFILSILWCGIMEAILMTLGGKIASLFDSDIGFVTAVTKMTRTYYLCAALLGIEFICATFIQAMDLATRAIVLSFVTRFLPVPLFATIIFFSNPLHKVYWTIWCFPVSDLFSFAMGLLFITEPWQELDHLDQAGYDPI